jgi:hypothetical protein
MKNYTSVALCLLAAAHMPQCLAQDSGSITGAVHGPYDDLVKYAPIQATNIETGENSVRQAARTVPTNFRICQRVLTH